jgi:hypothetical protein
MCYNKNHTSNITKPPFIVLRRSVNRLIVYMLSGAIRLFQVFLYSDLMIAREQAETSYRRSLILLCVTE